MSEKPEALRLTEPEALRVADGLEGKHSIGYQPYAAAELRRLHAENERLREEVRVRSLILDGFVGPVPTSDEWRMMCSKANELKAALRREETT